jgi:Fe-S-cluster containining protein
MNCLECKGACCEQLVLPVPSPIGKTGDAFDFLAARGDLKGKGVVLEQRCARLTEEGQCSIYGFRPRFCKDYKAGGPACLAAVARRRLPEHYAEIRTAADPSVQVLFPEWMCSRDTDGDGNCGRPACPECGK